MNEIQTTASTTPATTQAGAPTAKAGRDGRALIPRVDVLEDDQGITLLADLPGVPRERLDLRVESDTLYIEGEVGTIAPEGLEPVYAELRVPRYRRAFTLSRELDTGRIEANLRDGVLSLRIPKQEHARPRRIEVRAQ
jgi:HSP20 family protein